MADDERQLTLYTLIADIPAGETRSYGELARAIGANPRWVARQVGQLPHDTRLPWFRVIRSDGRIADHPGAAEQRERLRHEGVLIR